MKPFDRKFWGPWTAGMALAALMVLIGGFVPTQSQAQAAAQAKVKTAEKVAVAQVVAAGKKASDKVLFDAKVAAAVLAPSSAPALLAVVPAPAASVPVVAAAPALSVSELLDWLLKLAGLVLATLVPLLLNRWLGGKASAEQLAAYSKLAVDAIGHGEELAHQAVKNGKPKLDSNDKANAGVAYVLQAADALKLRPLAESAIKNLLDAKLGIERTTNPVALEISSPTVVKVTTTPKLPDEVPITGGAK